MAEKLIGRKIKPSRTPISFKMSSLSELVSELAIHSEKRQYKEAYEKAKRILDSGYSLDLDTLKLGLVAAINLDQYHNAGRLISRSKDHLVFDGMKEFLLLVGYVHYKNGDSENFETLLKDPAFQGRAFEHLKAQYYYKIGKNEEALKIYRELSKNPLDEVVDLSVNERAVVSQLLELDGVVEQPVSQPINDSYDCKFNDALYQLKIGDYELALDLLEEAKAVCEENTKDLPPDTREAEIVPILLQIAYVKQLEGKKEDSLSALKSLSKPKDFLLDLIYRNNLLSLRIDEYGRDDTNFHILYRELGFPNSIDINKDKLTVSQRTALTRNESLLALELGKIPSQSDLKLFHNATFESLDLNSKQEASMTYNYFMKRSCQQTLPNALLTAQLAINVGNINNAKTVLETVVSNNEKNLLEPSIVVPLYLIYDKLQSARLQVELLKRVADLLLESEISSTQQFKFFKDIAFKTLNHDEVLAKQLFEKLHSIHPNDELVSTYLNSSSNASNNNTTTTNFSELDDLVLGIDTDKLISEGFDTFESNKRSTTVSSSANKKRRTRLKPKHEAKERHKRLDEERWLPMKDRSYYRPKKGKKIRNTTQGTVTNNTSEISGLKKTLPKKSSKKKGRK
ncbi:BA75_00855T0 [Komagataella pastoris]|uniref:Signal recognition particle subunit SRP72 n=1 Tax=Komagataella pastoris TaxID=4922 RepID=A0A1B2J8F8_PICPA|nr:BA75_00855T0 [Komagataella pastoris]